MGDYEEEVDSIGNVRKIHYLSGAILVENQSKDSLFYTYTDNQGSLIALTNDSGLVKERYAYDPWGQRRNPNQWELKDSRTHWIVNRGYTGHEHLDVFGIINMNGRVFDPLTAQFFSPDPQLQDPGNWLNYNRYGYCYGNPLKYTDPTGEAIDPVTAIALTTAAMVATFEGSMAFENGGDFWQTFGESFVKSAVISLASSAIPSGIGNAIGHNIKGPWVEIARAGIHGLGNGLLNSMQGGNFWTGFAVGAASSGIGSGMQALKMTGEFLPLATGLAGAGTAALTHGDVMDSFWQGFGIGALNHNMEDGDKINAGYTASPQGITPDNAVKLREVTVIGHKHFEYIVSSLVYTAKYVNATRTQGTLNAYNLKGSLIGQYQATSGSGKTRKFTIPEGYYLVSGYTSTTDPKFSRYDIGFKINISPDPVWDLNKGAYRTSLRIHPARAMGTEGCIGLIGGAPEILQFQQQWKSTLNLNLNKKVPLTVTYR